MGRIRYGQKRHRTAVDRSKGRIRGGGRGCRRYSATAIATEAMTMTEGEWEDPTTTALAARRPLPSPLVCIYIGDEERGNRSK